MEHSRNKKARWGLTTVGLIALIFLAGAQSRFDESDWVSLEPVVELADQTEVLAIASNLRGAWHDPTRDDSTEVSRPKDWPTIEKALRKAVNDYRFRDAAAEVQKLEQRLPNPMPHDYPWSWDTLYSFQASRAELLFLAGDLAASKALCQEVIADIKSRKPADSFAPGSYALVVVDEVLADIAASEGDYEAAIKWYKKSLDEYWSGCGNCEESERVWASPKIQVLQAANLDPSQATDALKRITSGQLEIEQGNLYPTDAHGQRRHGATEATYALAQLALSREDIKEAKRLLELVVKSNVEHCEVRTKARVLLKRLALSGVTSAP